MASPRVAFYFNRANRKRRIIILYPLEKDRIYVLVDLENLKFYYGTSSEKRFLDNMTGEPVFPVFLKGLQLEFSKRSTFS